MLNKLGLPYMGSKRKLAPKIINHIIKHNPNTKYIYDLFGGGGAISFKAIEYPQIQKVFYNEIDTSITELLKYIKKNGITEEFYEWISRDDFSKLKKGSDWKSGLVKLIWSFGNRGASYMYGTKIVNDKQLLHKIIVNKDINAKIEFEKKYNIVLEIDNPDLFKETINERRLRIMRIIKKNLKVKHLHQIEHLTRLQHLKRLGHLESLQHLEKLTDNIFNNIEIMNKSYNDVKIITPIDETIIYLDPPYKNKRKYTNNVNHDELYKYILESKYKIYLSSYEYNLPVVKEMSHRSTLCATANNKVVEKLFCNKPNLSETL